jgi:hypothetical protein
MFDAPTPPPEGSDELPTILRELFADGRVSTHYDGCWRVHKGCAALFAADALDEERRKRTGLKAQAELDDKRISKWIASADAAEERRLFACEQRDVAQAALAVTTAALDEERRRGDELRRALTEAEPDLAAAYLLCNGTPLPMDMRKRVLRTLDRLRRMADD